MPTLTPQQIEALLVEAAALGFDGAELDGLRFALLDSVADLAGAERLDLAQQLIDLAESAAMDAFISAFDDTFEQHLAGVGVALDAIPDDEWAALTAPEDEENDNGETEA
jgi:hypothetical protein